MSTNINLKEIERKAFRSTFQDGLLDMCFGMIVLCMSFFLYHPANGYSAWNIIIQTTVFAVASCLFFVGKKFITLPRMGQVRFGVTRARKARTLIFILGAFILFQVGLVGTTAFGWLNTQMSAMVNSYLQEHDATLAVVAAIGSLMVGVSMIVAAFFIDFPRFYYIAVMMALAVFLMIYLNQPICPIIIGGLIILPGLLQFVRFLKKYPVRREETPNG